MYQRIIELNEFRILNQNETQMEKEMKKIIFIFISIIFPLIEILALIIQMIDIYNKVAKKINDDEDWFNGDMFYPIGVGFFTFGSLIFTWGMVSICYLEKKCLVNVLILKLIVIAIILLLSQSSVNFVYYLVFNVIGYGVFFTLIIVFKAFKKGIV